MLSLQVDVGVDGVKCSNVFVELMFFGLLIRVFWDIGLFEVVMVLE